MDKQKICMIAAIEGTTRALGIKDRLLWNLPYDLRRFRELTTGNTVIMGRKTWDSMGGKPLPNRQNIILSRSLNVLPGAHVRHSLDLALEFAETLGKKIYIIGGGEIYSMFLPVADELDLTIVNEPEKKADAFFPEYKNDFSETSRKDIGWLDTKELVYSFVQLQRKTAT